MTGHDPFDFDGARSAAGHAPVRPSPEPVPPPPGPGSAPPTAGSRFERMPGQATGGAAQPPVVWLAAALLVAVVAAVVAFLLGVDVGVAFLCWVLAGPAAIGLISVFVLSDTRARSRPLYIRPPWFGALWTVTVVAVVVGIGASAWRIADWWGRL